MSSDRLVAPGKRPRIIRTLRWLAIATLMLVALDQLARWTFLLRPGGELGRMIELTHAAAPPYFHMRPSLETTYESWGRGHVTRVRTNRLGFRDPERDAAGRDGVRRIVVTGDSITFGIGVEDHEAFPRQLEGMLVEAGEGPVEVWNAGVPGYAMADLLGMLRGRLLALRPDAIVLQLSRNDAASPMPLGDAFLESLRYSGLARAWMVYRFNFVEDPALFSSSFAAYVTECERARVPLVIAYEGLPDQNAAEVRRTARSHGLPLVAISGDAFPKLADDPHFDPEGNRRVAAALLPHVLAELDRAPRTGR